MAAASGFAIIPAPATDERRPAVYIILVMILFFAMKPDATLEVVDGCTFLYQRSVSPH